MEYIRESAYLQYFLGYEGYKDELPFDPSMMVHFRKRLSGNILKEINALILEKSKADDEGRDDGDEEKGAGEGEAKEPENHPRLQGDRRVWRADEEPVSRSRGDE